MKFWKPLLAAALLALAIPAYADRPDILETIELSGEIGDNMADMVTARVAELNENARVKAVLLVVDSPGGGVLPSARIYEELSKLKVPVVGFCQDICASGGMYVLMAPTVKYVGVRTATISGSIGVIMHVTRYNRLLEWAKIDSETYKSGIAKDSGSPTHAVTPEEVKELQGTIDDLAGRFYALVEKSRGSKIKDFADIKTARIFFGDEGVKAGLVDAVMSKEAAIAYAKKLSGSSSIFTRDELKKMSKDANDSGASYQAPRLNMIEQAFADLHDGVTFMREIARGGNVVVEYRAPFQY